MVAPANNTLAYIRRKVRRLTASASESSLTTSELDTYVNNFYLNDFPYAIKLDQTRSVYTFYTEPYIDKYPLDVNYNQGVRAPVYVEGIQGSFFKDRQQFFNMWPRWPTKFNQSEGASGTITGITQPSNPTVITSPSHGLITGAVITINNVVGMIELNGNTYTITVIDSNSFSLDGINNAAFTPYVSGGVWSSSTAFNFFVSNVPFLRDEVVIGGVDVNGNAISIADDGNGNLQLQTPNSITTVPPYTDVYTIGNAPVPALVGKPIPGMHNQNTLNPGLNKKTNIGVVNYVTGQIQFNLSIPIESGSQLTIWISQYQPGRPYSLLFWNNYFIIRPVPKLIHKVEVETYLTPVQFMNTTDNPTLNQWAKYIAIGASIDILNDRQDLDGVQNLSVMFQQQESLVLERQGVEEVGQRNSTIFSQTQPGPGWNYGSQGWFA